MKWGISLRIPVTYESDLLLLPPPSYKRWLSSSCGKQTIEALYSFEYAPQSWQEWQRVASIKKQIEHRIPKVEFVEYEVSDKSIGVLYSVTELGKHFGAFIKFPKPMFPLSEDDVYQKLCWHAKRLHHQRVLFLEQLIATSLRFNKDNNLGISQVMKRAISVYKFAQDNKDEWNQKLSDSDLHDVLSESAKKSVCVRQAKRDEKKQQVIKLTHDGKSISEISEILGVNRRTISRWKI